jgi:hypothetical protein
VILAFKYIGGTLSNVRYNLQALIGMACREHQATIPTTRTRADLVFSFATIVAPLMALAFTRKRLGAS